MDEFLYPSYLVTIKGVKEATTLHYADKRWFDDNGETYNVVAWKHMPEAYKEETNVPRLHSEKKIRGKIDELSQSEYAKCKEKVSFDEAFKMISAKIYTECIKNTEQDFNIEDKIELLEAQKKYNGISDGILALSYNKAIEDAIKIVWEDS